MAASGIDDRRNIVRQLNAVDAACRTGRARTGLRVEKLGDSSRKVVTAAGQSGFDLGRGSASSVWVVELPGMKARRPGLMRWFELGRLTAVKINLVHSDGGAGYLPLTIMTI